MPQIFQIVFPNIPSGDVYYFTTTSETKYEVRFGRRRDNIFHATIVFGVVNDEYKGEEYTTTNKGELYNVMATISEVIRIFMTHHPRMLVYEFTAVAKENEAEETITVRRHLYERYLGDIFGSKWTYEFKGNTVLVRRLK